MPGASFRFSSLVVSNEEPNLVPRPCPLMRKGSGDHWVLSWLFWISSLHSDQANETACHTSIHASQGNSATS